MKTFPCRRDGLPKFRNFTCHFRLLTTSLMCLYYDLGLLLIASSLLSATVSAEEEETTTTTITKVTESHSHPGHNHRNHSDVLPTAGFSHHTFPRQQAPILKYSFSQATQLPSTPSSPSYPTLMHSSVEPTSLVGSASLLSCTWPCAPVV